MPTTAPPSDRQVDFINRLLAERDTAGTRFEGHTTAPDGLTGGRDGTASAAITDLLALPKRQARAGRADEPEAGVYRDGETIFRVYFGQQSGRMLLKRIVSTDRHCRGHYDNLDGSYFECGIPFPTTEQQRVGLHLVDDADLPLRDVGCVRTTWEYEYVGLAVSNLPPTARPVSLEEAKAWGRLTETCMVCGRRLDVPESVDAGIGPKCARSFR